MGKYVPSYLTCSSPHHPEYLVFAIQKNVSQTARYFLFRPPEKQDYS